MADARASGNLARATEEVVPDVDRMNALAPAALNATRNEEFIRMLNAERNYALFAMAMMRETLDEAHSVLTALQEAVR